MIRDLNGSATFSNSRGGPSIAKDEMSNVAWTRAPELPQNIPPRPTLASQQSSSLPSTPYQHARDLHSRSPSPARGAFNTSPRSSHSESNHPLPPLRRSPGGCQYESGLAHFRRRMPYSLGADKLEKKRGTLKEHLDPEEDKKLSGDMRELYDRLLPSPESEERRRNFVKKLENLLNAQWPGNNIEVHVFGSSGNKLCTNDSDVDICITTPLKELEHVCLLADLLAKHGMERVVCVSHAKVPIVKIWDPELELACDMNVNNTMALENTRMIKTYVEIDDRVRPLAMIIKHWAKRRILNDAALGGTLSSYTWICMIIFFLQNRNPPILPVLQDRPHVARKTPGGTDIGFDDDLDTLRDYGKNNNESLGELLFQFFRFYGHEIDYETSVISIRHGRLTSKEHKGWHLLQNYRLCVEEPFNVSRNLGNTADDTAFRGIHIELRKAFTLVMEGNLEAFAEQYEYPVEEEKIFERPVPIPKPILSQTPKSIRQGGKGARTSSSNYPRGPNSNRRSSNASSRVSSFSNPGVTTREMLLQQQQAQFLLHDHLYQQIQYLQAQEQELRTQLALQGRPQPQLIRQSYPQFPSYLQEPAHDENSRARARTLNQPPLTAPLRQQVFQYPSPYAPMSVPLPQGTNTNPSSPLLTPVLPEFRRSQRRSSVTTGSRSGSLRAHSQPARPVPSPLSFQTFAPPQNDLSEIAIQPEPRREPRGRQQTRSSASPSQTPVNGDLSTFQGQIPAVQRSPYVDESRSSGYVGYYLGGSPSLQQYRYNPTMASLPNPYGLAIMNGLLPPFSSRPAQGRSPTVSPPSEDPFDPQPPQSPDNRSVSRPDQSRPSQVSQFDDHGPLIVDGSIPATDTRRTASSDADDQAPAMSLSTSGSGDQVYTPATGSDTMSQDANDRELDYPPLYFQPDIQARDSLGLANGHSVNQARAIQGPRLGSFPPQLLPIRTSPPESSGERTTSASSSTTEPASEVQSEREPQETPERARPEIFHDRGHPLHLAQLSPVEEIRTPSPTVRKRPEEHSAILRVNGAASYSTVTPGLEDEPLISPKSLNGKQIQAEILSKVPNGLASTPRIQPGPNPTSQTGGGWQTTKKKNRRRTNLSLDSAINTISGEPLPTNEAERKGG